jgi:hypothetical protein
MGCDSNPNYCYRDQDLRRVQAELVNRRVEYLFTMTHHQERDQHR